MYKKLKTIARVVKTHGKKGEVVTVSVNGLPSLMRENLMVCLVPPALKSNRWHRVAEVQDGPRGQLVTFFDVSTISDAEELVGKSILSLEEDLPEDLVLHDPNVLLGSHVVDEQVGELGVIAEVMVGPANDVWSIQGPYGEVLIPVVPEVIQGTISDGEGFLVRVPEGTLPTRSSEESDE